MIYATKEILSSLQFMQDSKAGNNSHLHHNTYITFKVGGEEYAAESNKVVSIISLQDLMNEKGHTIETRINYIYQDPAPDFIDLHDSLSVKKNDEGMESNIIITEINKEKVAFLVDEIDDFFYTSEQDERPFVLKSVKTKGEAVIRNVKYKDRLIQILDFEQLLKEKKNRPFRTI